MLNGDYHIGQYPTSVRMMSNELVSEHDLYEHATVFVTQFDFPTGVSSQIFSLDDLVHIIRPAQSIGISAGGYVFSLGSECFFFTNANINLQGLMIQKSFGANFWGHLM